MDPDDEAFEAVLATQRSARRVRFERTVALLRELGHADRRPGRGARDRRDDDALGRPTIARALIAAGFASERRGRLQPDHRARRTGLRARARVSVRRLRSRRSGRPAGCRCSPISARRRSEPDVIRELIDAGLGGLEVYYRSFDQATVDAMASRRRGARPRRDRRHRLPRRHSARTRRRTPQLWVPPEVGEALDRAAPPAA